MGNTPFRSWTCLPDRAPNVFGALSEMRQTTHYGLRG